MPAPSAIEETPYYELLFDDWKGMTIPHGGGFITNFEKLPPEEELYLKLYYKTYHALHHALMNTFAKPEMSILIDKYLFATN